MASCLEILELVADGEDVSSDEAVVNAIAGCLKGGGVLHPVVLGKDGKVLSGARRLSAAISAGLSDIDVIRFEDLPKSSKKNGVKDAVCSMCGNEWHVRRDTNPDVCKKCASSLGGQQGAITMKLKAKMVECAICRKSISKSRGQTYCSTECARKGRTVKRLCKMCLCEFTVRKSVVSGKTNASGNFCSRPCYDRWLCNTARVKGRGSRWGAIRKEVLNEHPFCAVCGKTGRLQVHHIVPYRLTHDNSHENLIPLCAKHHKIVEYETIEVEHSGASVETLFAVMSVSRRAQSRKSRMIFESRSARKDV